VSIRNDSPTLPVTGRFDFNRSLAQHLRRHKATSLLPLDYATELEVKQGAFEQYWEQHRLPGKPERIVPSPLPRHYRTTSKRRIEVHQGQVTAELDHIDLEALPEQAHLTLLEPDSHRQIYTLLLSYLEKPAYREFAKHVNFLIIRGTYAEHSVIFNVDQFDAEVVRKGKLLAEHLQNSPIPILSAFMFLDPSRSDYYFESRRPDAPLHFKKLFGPETLNIEVEGHRFHYEPTGFSQINLAIVPELVRVVRELLPADPGGVLLDLYCGYGLFGLNLAGAYQGVIGVDAAPGAIHAAEANRDHLLPGSQVALLAEPIDGRHLRRLLPEAPQIKEYVILDPPRQGTEKGVIEILAARRPAAVVHIFCGIEQLPREVPLWLHAGYRIERIVPLDLFPGTANLETCVLLVPAPPAPPQPAEVPHTRTGHAADAHERPYKKRRDEGGAERPFRKRSDEGGAERPFRKRSDEGGAERPYKKREEGGADRPYRKREEGAPERPRRGKPGEGPDERRGRFPGRSPERPYKKREEGGAERPFRKRSDEGGAERPYKKREEGAPGRPYKRHGEGGTSDRPFRKRSDEGGAERPYKNREEGAPGRPYKKREEGAPGRPRRGKPGEGSGEHKRRFPGRLPERPYRKREEGAPDRPYKKRSDEGGADRPYKKREEGAPDRPGRPAYPPRRRSDDDSGKPERRNRPAPPSRARPADRKGKPAGGYGKGRKGKPMDSKRTPGKKGPSR